MCSYFKNIRMKKVITIESWLFSIFTLLLVFHHTYSFKDFVCSAKTGNAPRLPKSYATNIRINFLQDKYSVEVHYATNGEEGKELFEFKRQDRHVKYITRNDQKSTLFIQYKEDEHPTCKVIKSKDKKDFLEKEDAGENRIVLKAAEVMMNPHMFNIHSSAPSSDTGVVVKRYEGCLSDPKINISMTFAADDWKQTHTTSLIKDVKYPEMAEAEVGDTFITAFYSYFDPTVPDDAIFQPPADVYCEGFRDDKKPPELPNYFSYNAEMTVYRDIEGISPIVSQRRIFYDVLSGISRMDFKDGLSQHPDPFSKIKAVDTSIIHDFHAGVQYILEPLTGKCTIDTFKATFNAISFEVREDNVMLNGKEYFWLNGASTSYNGQFPIRGLTADVYTALTLDPATKKRYIVSWYFSTEETRIVDNENVLLRMSVRPETGMDKENVTEINFYNFLSEQPSVFTYDLTSCFNESSSKILVFTFPAVDSLRGSEKMMGTLIHSAIVKATDVRKQRIYMKEVIFSGGYMYAEFILLDTVPQKGKVLDEEISLEDALKKLQDSVSKSDFKVNVPSGKNTFITLKPEPNGLNIFSGGNVRKPDEGYKEGSVIGLTIGMLILGFILGGVTLNLVMSRKFGISLFQKSLHGFSGFGNPLNESSI